MKRKCIICGSSFTSPPRHVKKGWGRYCSLKCKGLDSRSTKSIGLYKGFNVYICRTGYASIVLGSSHEQLFHRYLIEEQLGRKLERQEKVHHINGNRLDNRLSNLQVLSSKEHSLAHAHIRIKLLGGDPARHKYCGGCRTLKLRSEFHKSKSNYDGLYGYCKECACKRSQELRNKRRLK